MAMTSLGHALFIIFLFGIGTSHGQGETTTASDPCAANPCLEGTYCYVLPETEDNPYKCIENGHLYGNCSMNTVETCAADTKCVEAADRKSYECICEDPEAVGDGVRKDKGGSGCVLPVKECKEDKDCPQYGYCDASVGNCKCNPGFEGSGFECEDIPECADDPCDPNAICKETPGNFTCSCDGQKNYQGDGFTCIHVCLSDNDCDPPRGRCDADQKCQCKPGYKGNGTHCVDVDECADSQLNDCPDGGYCINEIGSYDCKCKNGYFGDRTKCDPLPTSCKDIPNFKPDTLYIIDPDGTGSAMYFEVTCDTMWGEIVTMVNPKNPQPIKADVGDTEVEVDYGADPEDIQPLLENSGFCFQDVSFDCYRYFNMFPGTKWYDAYGNVNENWGTEQYQKCACGAIGTCENNCNCDGEESNKWVSNDSGKFVDKGNLPVMRIEFAQKNVNKGKIKIDPLICMDNTAGFPKNCHDAKFNHGVSSDGALYIDVDGAGPIEPFLVYCDMKSYENVGITELNPNTPVFKITNIEGELVEYKIPGDKMKGLISGSGYCSQKIEFECKNSKLMGDGGYVSVGSEKRKLDYFPGANGVQNTCGCGATKSCASPEVTCNCNIDDGELRNDFGLIINKEDLPVVHVTGQFGDQKTSTYTVGPLKCAGEQFGIEPNCEKYRATGTNEDYTYFVDPDGPAQGVDPFLVECKFIKSPPQGKTIVHHEVEVEFLLSGGDLDLKYLDVSPDQIDALKDRSTYCSQEITVDCNKLKLQETNDVVDFMPFNETGLMSLLPFLQSCAGNGCNCNGVDDTNDKGELLDMGYIPVQKVDMSKLQSQLNNGASGSVTVGPLVCAEVFDTCNALQRFIKYNAPEGEAAVVNGLFTIDPDGAGGVDPFEVRCQFPQTIVPLRPEDKEVGPDPNNPDQPEEQCFDIQYTDDAGNPITPEQVDALAKASGNCRQELTLECVSAPASGKVNFTSCDGTTQTGWAGAKGNDGCACGQSGSCAGGPDTACNCDVGDDQLRQDKGTIYENEQLPICEVCLSAPSSQGTTSSPTPSPPMQKFKLGQLVCDGDPGLPKACQAARFGTSFSGEEQEVPTVLDIAGEKLPVACKYSDKPPIGAMVVNPRDPVFPPTDPESPVNVTIDYVTFRIDLIKAAMNRNQWCRQKIFFFCVGGQIIETGGIEGYYDTDGKAYGNWQRMPADSRDVERACEQYKDLCNKCGKPVAYVIKNKKQLPVQSIYLAIKGVTVVVDHVECMNIRKKCQDLMTGNQKIFAKIPKTASKYLIDPDGPGELVPFSVKCIFFDNWKVGITEIPVTGRWEGKVNVQNQQLPGQFEIPVEFEDADVDQVRKLAQISEFCWQNIKYKCSHSPLLNNGQDPASYYYLNESTPATSFGTDDKLDAVGCACGVLGTCTSPDVSCNCDAKGPMGVDQGAVTNKDVLPITQVNVGGQNENSNVDVTLSPIQCGKLPITPPRDCQHGLDIGERNTVTYQKNGEFLISPSPADTTPFMVYCDFNILPDKGVTVVKPLYPPNNTIDNPDEPEKVPYGGPDPEQIRALVSQSKFCYQGVKMECKGSQVFSGGASWLPAGSSDRQFFWGGGDRQEQTCACGKEQNCGGLDSYSGQRSRKCNCDIGDDVTRFDAGIITQKNFLPLSEFFFGQGAKFDNVKFTFGDLMCSQSEIPINECELGFHDCHPMAKCVDQVKGYTCVCQKGWEGKTTNQVQNAPRSNGRECMDDDECSWQPCSHFAKCHNTPGSFYCTCKPGFRALDPVTCEDIDECSEGTHDCHENARCENLEGSYRCACHKGYRGDGKSCRAVGECKCFGDPHCLSFDSRWLHYQGLCEYIMSKDNCESGGKPSYQVWTKYWRRGSTKPGYYSYVESVRILLESVEIKLIQNLGILVNGIQMDQFTNPDGVSAIKYNREVVVRAPNGLEVSWDGKDAVTVVVPENRKTDTCGMCGNYNGDAMDDWMVGETCEGAEGTVTDNFELFGNSWTVMANNSEVQCTPDCDPEVPPDPRDCENKELIEHECSKLLDEENSPFKQCLALMDDFDIEQFKMSCSYDLCFVEADFTGAVCDFAQTLSKECSDKYKTRITTWREEVDACEPGSCENNMIYKTCGPVSQETCMTQRIDIPVEDNPNECYEGCFCAEGLVMEGDKCIPKEDCGCLYNNQYIQKGQVVVNPDCQTKVKCQGGDQIVTSPVNCGENEECSLEDDGIVDCFCVEGFMRDPATDKCVVDPCYNVTCEEPNTACFEGECRCKMGYVGNCNSCQNVDECATGLNNCNKIGQKCQDLPGSFKCECEPGFIPDRDGHCKDIDECEIFSDKCGDNSECTNTLGSYSCQCCAGYKMNDKGECIRDVSLPKRGKCCACKGEKCTEPGKVCGTDGTTYNDYRSLAVVSCRNEKEVKVDYPGTCQATCETVQCQIPYQTCDMDPAGKPSCGCPTCEDSSFESVSDTVCATNKITYKSICHMKAATCEAELEVIVEVESVGKPCPPGENGGDPGPWTDWGDCSEPCKQGTMNRTRTVPEGSGYSDTEVAPCFSTCTDGPCTAETCKEPAQVCSADENDVPVCQCPVCVDFPESPVCGRIGTVIQTFENQCELQAEACNAGEGDFELLEPRACEDKPKFCGKVRKFHLLVDENGCKADRTVNVAQCYGGCDDQGDKCCFPIKKEEVQLIMSCPDSTFHRATQTIVTECKCIDNAEAEELAKKENPEMNVVT